MPSLLNLVEHARLIYSRMEEARPGAYINAVATSLYIPSPMGTKTAKLDAVMAPVSKNNPTADLTAEQLTALLEDEKIPATDAVLALRIAHLRKDEAVDNPGCTKLKALADVLFICAQAYSNEITLEDAQDQLNTSVSAYDAAFASQVDSSFIFKAMAFLAALATAEQHQTISMLEIQIKAHEHKLNELTLGRTGLQNMITSLSQENVDVIEENLKLIQKNQALASENKRLTGTILLSKNDSTKTNTAALPTPSATPASLMGRLFTQTTPALSKASVANQSEAKRGCQTYTPPARGLTPIKA